LPTPPFWLTTAITRGPTVWREIWGSASASGRISSAIREILDGDEGYWGGTLLSPRRVRKAT
jgi:hypothetical protein